MGSAPGAKPGSFAHFSVQVGDIRKMQHFSIRSDSYASAQRAQPDSTDAGGVIKEYTDKRSRQKSDRTFNWLRFGETGLGIHRGYSTDTTGSLLADADKRVKQLDTAVRAYFKEMNVSDALADEMLRTAPQDVKFLTVVEARRYGLEGTDASYEDLMASRMATRYGISKREYYQRDSRAKLECPFRSERDAELTKWIICKQAIMYGVSGQEYLLRSARLGEKCNNIKGNVEAEWACERSVIHGQR